MDPFPWQFLAETLAKCLGLTENLGLWDLPPESESLDSLHYHTQIPIYMSHFGLARLSQVRPLLVQIPDMKILGKKISFKRRILGFDSPLVASRGLRAWQRDEKGLALSGNLDFFSNAKRKRAPRSREAVCPALHQHSLKRRLRSFHQPHTDHIKHCPRVAPAHASGRVRQTLPDALSRYYKLESEAEKKARREVRDKRVKKRETPKPRENTGQRGCKGGKRKKGKQGRGGT